jgi:pyridoxal 5'-phosphate synthase pdxT subunit
VNAPTVGVLALQGAFAAHARVLRSLGARPVEIRSPADLAQVAALVLPGGESTTMSMLLDSAGLFEPLSDFVASGAPVLGTCAGMILLASAVTDGRSDQRSLGGLDISVRRNGYGRQLDSFEADVAVTGLDTPFHAVFIRAPVVLALGPGVEALATMDGVAVLCRSRSVIAASFHPELSGDDRIHKLFLAEISHAEPRP